MFRSTAGRLLVALLVVGGVGAGAVVAMRDGAALDVPVLGEATPSPSPDASRAPLLPPLPGGTAPSGAGLATALGTALKDPRLGTRVVVAVVDVDTGEALLETSATAPVVPASTAKIVTAAAVLTALEPDRRLTTTVLAGPQPGDVVVRGGGDPTLTGPGAKPGYPVAARLPDLARSVRSALGATPVRRVVVDGTLFSGPTTGPGWRPGYVADGDVAPVSALSVDGGRVAAGKDPRSADPALAAGRALGALLQPGASVRVVRGVARPGAAVLGEVSSAPVAALVEDMLARSDNDLAEALLRHVAIARGQPGSFAGVAAALPGVLGELEVAAGAVVLVDGSGLSRTNRVQPAALARLVARAADDPRLAPLVSGLPVAGFDGTLAKRFRTGPAAGQVRAKTGTLNGVSALAGLVRTRDGRLLAFDVTADGVPIGAGRAAEAGLDAVAAALAGCGCP